MKVEFTGDYLSDIVPQVMRFLVEVGVDFSLNPSPQGEQDDTDVPAGTGEPEPVEAAEEAEVTPEQVEVTTEQVEELSPSDPTEDKKDAIKLLMDIYKAGKVTEVKDLLSDFGVSKFGDIPDEKGTQLLDAAKELA